MKNTITTFVLLLFGFTVFSQSGESMQETTFNLKLGKANQDSIPLVEIYDFQEEVIYDSQNDSRSFNPVAGQTYRFSIGKDEVSFKVMFSQRKLKEEPSFEIEFNTDKNVSYPVNDSYVDPSSVIVSVGTLDKHSRVGETQIVSNPVEDLVSDSLGTEQGGSVETIVVENIEEQTDTAVGQVSIEEDVVAQEGESSSSTVEVTDGVAGVGVAAVVTSEEESSGEINQTEEVGLQSTSIVVNEDTVIITNEGTVMNVAEEPEESVEMSSEDLVVIEEQESEEVFVAEETDEPEMVEETHVIEEHPLEINGEVAYVVQIGAAREPMTDWEKRRRYTGDREVEMFTEDGWYKYYVAKTSTYFEAKEIMNETGAEGAFIAAYKPAEKVAIPDAIKNDVLDVVTSNDDKNYLGDVSTINFDYNVFTLDENGIEVLENEVLVQLNENGYGVEVSGHSDNRGSKAYNTALALQRAKQVKDFLTNNDVASDRIHVVTRGEDSLVNECSNSCSEDDHYSNRRVEIRFYE